MNDNLQKKINQLRKLKQCKNYTDAQIIDLANKSLKDKKLKAQYDFVLEGLPVTDAKERKILRKILEDYLGDVYIESKKQLFELKNLVYIIYKQRTSRERIEKQEQDKPNSIPKYAYDAYHNLIEQGQKLSEKIFGSDLGDDVSVLKQFFSRLKIWMGFNQGSRTFRCAKCQTMLVAKIRMDKYDVDIHPYFIDSLLTNSFLMKKYIEHKPVIVTEKFIAEVLNTSELYTQWFLDRHFNKQNPLYKKYLERKEKNVNKKIK